MRTEIVPISTAVQNIRKLVTKKAFITKGAELGSNQVQFEQAFSSLGHSFMADKAPKLLQYELGFQLVEKNDDGTRAVGIFAFKVGDHMLYAPVFFLNGDLKGHDLLYIKNQDLFVPLKDSWVNYLIGRKPISIGGGVDRNLSGIGVQGPNLYQISRAPHKWASTGNWRDEALALIEEWSDSKSPFRIFGEKTASIAQFIKDAGVGTFKRMLQYCQAYPPIVEKIDKYNPGLLEDATNYFKQASEKKAGYPGTWAAGETPKHHLERIKVLDKKELDGEEALDSVVPYRSGKKPKMQSGKSLLQAMSGCHKKEASADLGSVFGLLLEKAGAQDVRKLSTEDRKTLTRQHYLIKDTRDKQKVNHGFDVATDFKLTNPEQTGIYHVLVRPNLFRRCLVVMKPHSHSERHSFCLVVDLENKKWVNIASTEVWTDAQEGMEDFRNWYENLESPTSRPDGLMILVTRDGQATVPFRVNDYFGEPSSKDYTGVWNVHFRNWSAQGTLHGHGAGAPKNYGVSSSCLQERIRFTGKSGSKINRHEGGELWVPADVKVLELKSPPKEKGIAKDDDCCRHDSSDPGPLEPGCMGDVVFEVRSHAYPLKITSHGDAVTMRTGEKQARHSKPSAILSLVMDHGLTEASAIRWIKKAEEKGRGNSIEIYIKEAAPSANLINSGPNAPSFPETPVGYDPMTGGKYPTQETMEWGQPVQDMVSRQGRREDYNPTTPPDQAALKQVMDAAQSGYKEVFDTTMLGGLLKSVRDDTVIDRYLPDLMKGMNGLGRLLFSFYWHQDQFADRYGRADLSEIEDGLRNAFESTGEVLLTLKARTANSALDEGMSSGDDLEDIANV